MKNTFGEFLTERRKEKGLTQKELAGKLFVSESALSKWEQNRANPDITVLPTLAEILGVSEHELITASIDDKQRENSIKAKKWNALSLSWHLFFYISYGITLLTCFIVNLAVSKTLSWFFIVLASILLASSFTTLPRFIKKFKLLVITIFELALIILLLGVCCIYVKGDWFFVSTVPIIVAFIMVFLPIYLKTYDLPKVIKLHNAIFSLLADFLALIIMYYVIEDYADSGKCWATKTALPITAYCLGVALFVVYIIRYTKINGWLKSSFTVLTLTVFLLPIEIFLNLTGLEKQITYAPNFSKWYSPYTDNNVKLIIMLSLLLLSTVFALIGILKHVKNKREE